jgi:hypothetical protein
MDTSDNENTCFAMVTHEYTPVSEDEYLRLAGRS